MEGSVGEGWGVLPPFRWSGVSLCIFLAVALGGMEQRRLGVRCVVTDTRRRSTLSGVGSSETGQGRCNNTSLKMDMW